MFTLLKRIVVGSVDRWFAAFRQTDGRRAAPTGRHFRPTLEEFEERVVPSGTVLASHAAATASRAGVADVVAPVVTSARASGPSSNSISAVELTFSQPIVPSTFTAADVNLTGPKGAVKITSVKPVAGTNDKTFTIAFADQTAPGTYTLKVGSKAKNAAGTSVKEYRTAFAIAPPVVTSAKASGPTSNSLSSIRVTFSQAITPSTFTAADVSLTGPKGTVAITSVTPVAGTGQKTFTIAFAKQTAPGTYTLKIGTKAKTTTGIAVTAYQTKFTIAAPRVPAGTKKTTGTAAPKAQTAVAPPQPVVSSATASGPATNSLSTIEVTFSQPIVPSTFTATDVSLMGPNGTVAITSVTPVAGTNNKSFAITFADQTAPGTYTLNIGTKATDAAGVAVTAFQTGFTIVAPPVVTSATASGPSSNSISAIEVTFSQPIVPATFTAADVGLVGPNGAVAITSVTPVAATNNESFTIGFANQTTLGTYTLTIGTNAENAAGIPVTEDQTTFTIASTTNPSDFTGTLTPGKSISSSNGQYTLTLQTDGNLVESTAAGTALWATETGGKTVTGAAMQADGNLVLYNGTTVVWASNTSGNPGAFLNVQNDGDVVIYSGTTPVWTSNSAQPVTLLPGQSISSSNGQFVLTLQTDGNLVEYNAAGTALWATGTGGRTVTEAVMQADGNLVLYDGTQTVWASNTSGAPGAFLTVQNTGTVVIYSGTTAIWTAQPTTLLPGQSMVSPNGDFVLTLQTDGNLVEYNGAGTAVWASGTQGKTVTEMIMQGDGNLVLYGGSTAVWASNTSGNPGASLGLQNNGALVISSGGTQVWTADLTVQQNGVLLPGEAISSPNGQYTLVLQSDGNLVKYNSSGAAMWSSGTAGQTVTQMIMQADGNLVLYNGSQPVWASNTAGHPGAFLSVGNNGALTITSGGTQIWVK
jgi:methionine-rich copper-binding protein CopC